jgi:fatty-acid peroxygenase
MTAAILPRPAPRLRQWDSSLALLADPYRFIGNHCKRLGSDVFEATLLFQDTLCMSGEHAAALFYDPQRFQREGAAPELLQATLFGKGGVQGLDGAPHRERKSLFMALTAAPRVQQLVERARDEWERELEQWATAGTVPLYSAIQPVLTRAVCAWAGVPLPEDDVPTRSRQLTALFDGAASGVRAHLQARLARRQAEGWLAAMVERVRDGHVEAPAGSPLHALAGYREPAGGQQELLSPRIAAVELLNLLRPTVAVSVYIAFVAHALQTAPIWKSMLAEAGSEPDALNFVQEVRRCYPFFPAVAARVRESFDWEGIRFPAGQRVLLDLYGTNHDSRSWDEPNAFRPQRWSRRACRPFDFVPQGGGNPATGHRCPGEDIATQLMLLALEMLLRRMRYKVPPQELRIVMNRLPALPRQGFLISDVRRAG